MTNAISESDVLRVLGQVLTVYLERQTVEPSALPGLTAELRWAISGERGVRPRAATNNAVLDPEGDALPHDLQASAVKVSKAETAIPTDAERIAASVKPDCIVCLEDGQSFRSLKRHLRVQHGLTPEEYRAKWGLPKSYPLVAPALAEQRSRLAYEGGFGRDPSKDVSRAP